MSDSDYPPCLLLCISPPPPPPIELIVEAEDELPIHASIRTSLQGLLTPAPEPGPVVIPAPWTLTPSGPPLAASGSSSQSGLTPASTNSE